MSRVYRALEKAEEEKKQKVREETFLKVFDEKAASKSEAPTLLFPEEEIAKIEKTKDLGLPSKEEVPVLITPPHSFSEEEFRKLKTQIFMRLPKPPHSILITSVAPQEGKTTVAVNLAMAISKEIHRKAILIDGDLRKPGVHVATNQKVKGLSNFLLDGTALPEVLIHSEMENLRIITAGPPSDKAPELIGSKRMGELLHSLSDTNENIYILIDSPPIVSATEPTLLSKLVDGIILVVRAGKMQRESIQRGMESIDRQKIIGVVFNDIALKSSSYYSKHYHKYWKR